MRIKCGCVERVGAAAVPVGAFSLGANSIAAIDVDIRGPEHLQILARRGPHTFGPRQDMRRRRALTVEPVVQKVFGEHSGLRHRAEAIEELGTNVVRISASVRQVSVREDLRKNAALAAGRIRELASAIHVGIATKLLVLELLAQLN